MRNDGRLPVDPVGLWYAARARAGIDDGIRLGIATRDSAGCESFRWYTERHRDVDGIGGLQQVLQSHGCAGGDWPRCRDRAPAGLRDILAGWRRARADAVLSAPADIRWHHVDATRAGDAHDATPCHTFLDDDTHGALQRAARQAGVSITPWLAWTLDRAVRATLVHGDSRLRWVYPVNLRGAVQAPRPWMNHCGGLAPCIDASHGATDFAAQLRTRFACHEHWRSWRLLNLGRCIGRPGVELLWRLTREAPGSWAGSYTNLGRWPLPGMRLPVRGPAITGAICVAPGSPAYPVSAGALDWQGRLALACRVHPVVDRDGQAAARLLQAWQVLARGD